MNMNTEQPMKICLVAHLAYGALCKTKSQHRGGVERQASLMSKWLASRGHRVTVLTWDEGGPPDENIDGVRVIKICRERAGLRWLRFWHPRWTSLIAAMKRANADLYFQNCGEYVTGQVAMWCHRHGRKFVYSVASDVDCEARLPEMHALSERVLYQYGLKAADRVIVQTYRQRELLLASFGVDSTVLRMPCVGFGNEAYSEDRGDRVDGPVLWVGRLASGKRPHWLLRLASQFPDLQFDIVGAVARGGYGSRVVEAARASANIRVHGQVNYDEMAAFYRRSAVMLCTSAYEGFPNTFLEAWSCGLPVVSTFDPDDLISHKRLGMAASDIEGLAAGLRELMWDRDLHRQCSENARRYFLATHAVDKAMPRFEEVLGGLCREARIVADAGSRRCGERPSSPRTV